MNVTIVLKDFLLTLLLSVILKERAQVDAESFVSVAGAAAEEIREVVVEEKKIIEEAPQVPQPPVTVKEREDDWFVLLDAIPREAPYVPPGTVTIPCTASQNSVASLVLCPCAFVLYEV